MYSAERRTTSEEPKSREAIMPLTSRAQSRGHAIDMAAVVTIATKKRRNKIEQAADPTRTTFLINHSSQSNINHGKCVCFARFPKRGDTGTVFNSPKIWSLLSNVDEPTRRCSNAMHKPPGVDEFGTICAGHSK